MHCPTVSELPPPPPGKTGWPWTKESRQLPDKMLDGNPWPKISIITPNYNYGRFLEETIRSVLLQGYPNLEYIIIDGCSADNSVEIIKKYEKWLAYWISEPDCGIYDAFNKGIKIAKGDWIYFIGAGDRLVNADILKEIFSVPRNVDILYGNVYRENQREMYGGKFSRFRLTQQNICHQAIFYRSWIFEKFGMFELKYRILADYQFNMKCFGDKKVKVAFIDKLIAFYKGDGKSECAWDSTFFKDKENLIRKYLGIRCWIYFKFKTSLCEKFRKGIFKIVYKFRVNFRRIFKI